MASNPISRLTEEQYLALEQTSEIKHEFYDGEMFAMSGGTVAHARLQADLLFEFVSRLRGGPCEAVGSELRIRVDRTRLYTYPDIAVVCGPAKFADGNENTLLNPKVVVEILSPSTEKYDRGRKFQHYREIESLTDYILVSQDAMRIEQYTREPDGTWRLRDYSRSEEELKIESAGVSIPLSSIYARVVFDQPPALRDVQPDAE